MSSQNVIYLDNGHPVCSNIAFKALSNVLKTSVTYGLQNITIKFDQPIGEQSLYPIIIVVGTRLAFAIGQGHSDFPHVNEVVSVFYTILQGVWILSTDSFPLYNSTFNDDIRKAHARSNWGMWKKFALQLPPGFFCSRDEV